MGGLPDLYPQPTPALVAMTQQTASRAVSVREQPLLKDCDHHRRRCDAAEMPPYSSPPLDSPHRQPRPQVATSDFALSAPRPNLQDDVMAALLPQTAAYPPSPDSRVLQPYVRAIDTATASANQLYKPQPAFTAAPHSPDRPETVTDGGLVQETAVTAAGEWWGTTAGGASPSRRGNPAAPNSRGPFFGLPEDNTRFDRADGDMAGFPPPSQQQAYTDGYVPSPFVGSRHRVSGDSNDDMEAHSSAVPVESASVLKGYVFEGIRYDSPAIPGKVARLCVAQGTLVKVGSTRIDAADAACYVQPTMTNNRILLIPTTTIVNRSRSRNFPFAWMLRTRMWM